MPTLQIRGSVLTMVGNASGNAHPANPRFSADDGGQCPPYRRPDHLLLYEVRENRLS